MSAGDVFQPTCAGQIHSGGEGRSLGSILVLIVEITRKKKGMHMDITDAF